MSAALLALRCVAELVLFLLPGLAVTVAILRRKKLTALDSLITTIAASGALGYLAFWVYFANKTAGQIVSYGLMAAALLFVLAARRRRPLLVFDREFITPVACVLCLALFNLSLLYLFVNPVKAGVDVANVRFFPQTRPGDNIIPFIFAQRIYDRAPIRPFCCGDWLSSDRPPLQAGIFLLQRPLRVAGNTGLQYQVLGTLLQCLWVCGVWTLLRTLEATVQRTMQTLGLLVFSGFLFYNTVYTWPKLLAATFVLFVFAIVARAVLQRRALTTFETVLASSCFVLGLLAHPGSVFSAPALVWLWLWRRNLLTLKKLALAVAIIAAALVPWTFYQKLYDPPGDRLLKMHLAGVMEPDGRSTVQDVRDAYGRLSAGTALRNRWANVETIVTGAPDQWRGLRVAEREYVSFAIGILLSGALLAIVPKRFAPQLPFARAMILFAGLNLLVWSLVLFGPGATFTEHGSYADILLLSVGFSAFLLGLPRPLVLAVAAIQLATLIFVWVLYRPAGFVLPTRAVAAASVQWPMIALAGIAGCFLVWGLGRSYFVDPERC